MSAHTNSTATPASQGKRSRIQRWLAEEGWQITELQHPDAVWLFQVFDSMGHGMGIIQPKSSPDRIVIQSPITIDADRQRALSALSEKVRQALVWEIRSGLLAIGLDFTGLSDPLSFVGLTQQICDDGLTKDRFTQRILQVKRGVALVFGCILRALEEPPPRETDTGFIN